MLSLTGAASETPVAEAAESATAEEHGHDDTGPGALALFVAILALLVGGTGAFLGWRSTRRTVSS